MGAQRTRDAPYQRWSKGCERNNGDDYGEPDSPADRESGEPENDGCKTYRDRRVVSEPMLIAIIHGAQDVNENEKRHDPGRATREHFRSSRLDSPANQSADRDCQDEQSVVKRS